MKQTNKAVALRTVLSLALASTTAVLSGGMPATASPRSAAPGLSAPAPQEEATPSTRMRPIHFDFDKAELRPRDEAALKANATLIKGDPAYTVVIAGFADARGSKEYNLALAQRRAETVRDYLVKQGVRAERVEIVSYGMTDPRCTRSTENCWARNRRVELLVKPARAETP